MLFFLRYPNQGLLSQCPIEIEIGRNFTDLHRKNHIITELVSFFYKKDLSLHYRCGDYSPWAIFQSSNVAVICHALHQLLYGRGVDTQVRCQLGIGDARIVTHQSGDASVSVLERGGCGCSDSHLLYVSSNVIIVLLLSVTTFIGGIWLLELLPRFNQFASCQVDGLSIYIAFLWLGIF